MFYRVEDVASDGVVMWQSTTMTLADAEVERDHLAFNGALYGRLRIVPAR